MSNELQIFNYQDKQIRTVEIDGDAWFVGKDVAEALGYGSGKSPINAVKKHVDPRDKLSHQFSDSGQRRDMTIINESGLYSLILSSKLESAKEFKHWVTSEVLPLIARHGIYVTGKTAEFLRNNPGAIEKLLQDQERMQKTLNELQDKVFDELPYTTMGHLVMSSPDTYTNQEAGQFFAQMGFPMGLIRFCKTLREIHWTCSRPGCQYNKPTQKAIKQGYMQLRISGEKGTSTIAVTTGKGLKYLLDKFSKENYPIIMMIEEASKTE